MKKKCHYELFNYVATAISLLCLIYLYLLHPYAKGYLYDKQALIILMQHGYAAEGGEWMFGYYVLPLLAVLIYLKRKPLSQVPLRGSQWGILFLALAAICYVTGSLGNEKYLGYFAGQLFVLAGVIWFYGWRFLTKIFWLWVLLALLWPVLPAIDKISYPLRIIATKISVEIWNFFGGEALQNGTAIVSKADAQHNQGERYYLQIAVACSGLRSLFALLMIGIALIFLQVQGFFRQCYFMLAVLPIAIIANVVRIIMLLAGTILFGYDFAIGSIHNPSTYHLLAGFMVYIIGVILFMKLVSFGQQKATSQVTEKVTNLWPLLQQVKKWQLTVIVIVTVILLYLTNNQQRQNVVQNTSVKLHLPTVIPQFENAFHAEKGEFSEVEKKWLPPGTKVKKMQYYPISGKITTQPIAVSLIQGSGDDRSLHRPQVCLTGQGWNIESQQVETIEVKGKPLSVMHLKLSRENQMKGQKKMVVQAHYFYYWLGNQRATTSYLLMKWLHIYDSIVKQKLHQWAAPSLQIITVDGTAKQVERAKQHGLKILQQLVPYFDQRFK